MRPLKLTLPVYTEVASVIRVPGGYGALTFLKLLCSRPFIRTCHLFINGEPIQFHIPKNTDNEAVLQPLVSSVFHLSEPIASVIIKGVMPNMPPADLRMRLVYTIA